MEAIVGLLVALVIMGVLGMLGSAVSVPPKKRLGFWLGFLLGPIGILIAAVANRS